MKKVVVTGGHMTPALAVIEELKRKGWEVVYVGRKHALEGDAAISQEYQEVRRRGITFIALTSGRLQRSLTRFTFLSLVKIPVGLWQSFFYLLRQRPDAILSFGGYLAVPVVMSAWICRIPVVTHEQTLSPGLANRLISRLAQKICISWVETATFFPKNKIVLTGNPIRREALIPQATFELPQNFPCIYITGGNLGAHSINTAVAPILTQLLAEYVIIHQCGNALKYNDYAYLLQQKKRLPLSLQKRYFPVEYIESRFIGSVLQQADLIVTRAGANILSEIVALKKIALFIPLPWSGLDEQLKNAQYLVSRGAADMLLQTELTNERLLTAIQTLFKQKHQRLKNLNKISSTFNRNAASQIAEVVESVA